MMVSEPRNPNNSVLKAIRIMNSSVLLATDSDDGVMNGRLTNNHFCGAIRRHT